MSSHSELAETYRNEFEKRNTGGHFVAQNPALDWQRITMEVAALDNRNAGIGYSAYAQQRAINGDTHEQAMEWISKNVIWR